MNMSLFFCHTFKLTDDNCGLTIVSKENISYQAPDTSKLNKFYGDLFKEVNLITFLRHVNAPL